MKRTLLLSFIVALATCIAASAQELDKRGKSVEQQLTDLTAEWLRAGRTHDAAALDKVLAPEFWELNSEGHLLTRTQLLDNVKSTKRVVDDLHSDDLQFQVYGNFAIVTDRTTLKVHDDKGLNFTGYSRFIRVYVKRHGKWQAVAAQGTPLKD